MAFKAHKEFFDASVLLFDEEGHTSSIGVALCSAEK
jgi:hypothetical protein